MLHAPDFLGYESAIEMARDHRGVVERALGSRRPATRSCELVGGREIHPVNVRVGGFYRAPTRRELRPLVEQLERGARAGARGRALDGHARLPRLRARLRVRRALAARRLPDRRGRLVSSGGLDIAPAEYDEHFGEQHVPHSTALHARLRGGGTYLVGPLARYALNRRALSPLAREAAAEAGLGPVCRNPFQSIVVRAVEMLYAFDEALRLIDAYEPPDRPAVAVEPRAATGYGWTEAPRGMLYHRYRLDADGTIWTPRSCRRPRRTRRDRGRPARASCSANVDLDDEALRLRCEQAIRNYDPCISCATHFLKLEVDRR